jgi:RHS repeat-associated protein
VITDQYGDWKEKIEYFPFGSYREDVKNPLDPNSPYVNYTFTDQEDDDELGLYNYKARLYDPLLGRFISPDPYMSPNLVSAHNYRSLNIPLLPNSEQINFFSDPQKLNRYTYCLNNPLIYVDPTGESYIVADFWGYETCYLYSNEGDLLAIDNCANDVVSGKTGFVPGEYSILGYHNHPGDEDVNGPYGQYGHWIFTPDGKAFHAGRMNKGGYKTKTDGCGRGEHEFLQAVFRTEEGGDKVTKLYVKAPDDPFLIMMHITPHSPSSKGHAAEHGPKFYSWYHGIETVDGSHSAKGAVAPGAPSAGVALGGPASLAGAASHGPASLGGAAAGGSYGDFGYY